MSAVPLRRSRWLGLLAVIVLAACASPSAPASTQGLTGSEQTSALPTSAAAPSIASTASAVAGISGTFDIGNGRSLYMQCAGSGSPTILLEAGDQDNGGSGWARVFPKLVGETRTCFYDRAGLGRSSPATGCREMDDILGDLEHLLAAAKLEGPFVVVGASGGGFIAAAFAARHPGDVAGMVFVETPKALTAALYLEILPEIACDAPGNVEHRDYLAVEHAAWDHRAKIGDFPLTVMSNDWGDSVRPNSDEATNVADQRGWFVLSPERASQVVVTSGHDINDNEPGLVVEEILKVLAAARAAA